MNAIDLASLLCSRLCHDLLSPVGALNNGIELLADEQDPEMRERCLELLAESARASANKLKFFRLAFGAAGGFGDEIDTREARAALEGLFGAERRIELGWMVDERQMPKGAVKLLLNLAMIAGDALVRGGRLDVGAERTTASDRAGHPRRRPAHPARSDAARDAAQGQRRNASSRARRAPGWRTACSPRKAGGRSSSVDPGGDRTAADRRVTLPLADPRMPGRANGITHR
jgi:histidine phosphotransferase ChpT